MRRRRATIRKISPDILFNSAIIEKFINIIMLHGKKSVIRKVVYKVLLNLLDIKKNKKLDLLSLDEKSKQEALVLFNEALEILQPKIEVKSRRIGGATYQVPIEIKENRSKALAMRWIVESSKKRTEHSIEKKITYEILDVLEKKGRSIKRKDDLYKMAKANQAFIHYKW